MSDAIIALTETGIPFVIQPAAQTNFILSAAYQGEDGPQGPIGPGVPGGGADGQFIGHVNGVPAWAPIPASDFIRHVVTQTAHGFTLGQIVRLGINGYFLSQANTRENSEVLGLVTYVPDANHFGVTLDGYISGVFQNLPIGVVLFLSDTNPGQLTTVEPTNQNSYSVPLFIADSANGGYFYKERGIRVGL